MSMKKKQQGQQPFNRNHFGTSTMVEQSHNRGSIREGVRDPALFLIEISVGSSAYVVGVPNGATAPDDCLISAWHLWEDPKYPFYVAAISGVLTCTTGPAGSHELAPFPWFREFMEKHAEEPETRLRAVERFTEGVQIAIRSANRGSQQCQQ